MGVATGKGAGAEIRGRQVHAGASSPGEQREGRWGRNLLPQDGRGGEVGAKVEGGDGYSSVWYIVFVPPRGSI